MTDARLPGRWMTDMRFFKLSDHAWRVWTYALMFGAEQGTDGLIERGAFQFLHRSTPMEVLDELSNAGLIEITHKGDMQVLDWVKNGQELESVVQQRRENNRVRAQRYREQQGKPKRAKETGDGVRDVTRDTTDTPEVQVQGQMTGTEIDDRQGFSGSARENVTPMAQWPTRQPGSGVVS